MTFIIVSIHGLSSDCFNNCTQIQKKKVSERNQQHSSNVERKIQQPQTTVYIHIKEAGNACEQNTTR